MKKLTQFILHVFHDYIFPRQLAFGVFFLNLLGDKKYCQMLHEKIKKCHPGTVGHALRLFMKKHGFKFVPWYEKHDLKHVILGYGTTAPQEMCMQAFMFGNAGFRPIITLITLSFLIWTPDAWKHLPYHYFIGKMAAPVGGLKVEDVAERELVEVRRELKLAEAKEKVDAFYKGLELI